MTLFENDFRIVQFKESHSSRLDGNQAFGAHYDEISEEDHTYVCTAEEHKIRKNWRVLVLNSQGTNGPMKQREDHAEAIKIKERYGRTKTPSQQTTTAKTKSTVLKDSVNEPNELTRKLGGDGILLPLHQVHLRHGGNHQKNGGLH